MLYRPAEGSFSGFSVSGNGGIGWLLIKGEGRMGKGQAINLVVAV